jgi:hypothetical protein
MGLGLVSEGPREPHLTLVVKKKLAVLDGPNTVASAKVVVDSDLKASNVRIGYSRMRFPNITCSRYFLRSCSD